MNLTAENKRKIDSLVYTDLLNRWRFGKLGDPWLQGETLAYWLERMRTLRNQPGGQDMHAQASALLGWKDPDLTRSGGDPSD